jgi:hypothetical protein
MSIIAILAREHRLFERLVQQLEDGADLPQPLARARVAEALLVLLPALERHDRIEDLVFGDEAGGSDQDSRRAHDIVDAQHQALRALREEIEVLLRDEADSVFNRLRGLILLLTAKLQWHFKTEEMLLWPRQAALGRSVGRSLEREAAKSVAELEAAVASLTQDVRRLIEG